MSKPAELDIFLDLDDTSLEDDEDVTTLSDQSIAKNETRRKIETLEEQKMLEHDLDDFFDPELEK